VHDSGLLRWLAWGGDDVSTDLEWLSAAELTRLGTFRFTKRRNEYLLRRWAAKQAVAATLALHTTRSAWRRSRC
jgi:hypothetical protein